MAKTKELVIYRISRYWTRCEVWHGSRKSHERLGTSTLTTDKGVPLAERRRVISEWLVSRFEIPAPEMLE
jgi:hypothetical protein